MSNLQEILLKESENTCHIYLYREGVFYKAYERSAYLFVKHVKPFLVKKRSVKSVKQDVVSVGFPTNSLLSYFDKDKIREDERTAEVALDVFFDPAAFFDWREKIELSVASPAAPPATSPSFPPSLSIDESSIVMRIRTFPIEVKTPLDCMMFLSELKKML